MNKTAAAIMAVVALIAVVSARAAWDDNPNFHYPQYRVASFTNNTADTSAGVSDIELATTYIMIPVTNINFLTVSGAATNVGSWKAITFGLVDTLFEQYNAQVSTNQATKQRLTRTVRTTSGSDVKFTHTIETDVNIGGSSSVASE